MNNPKFILWIRLIFISTVMLLTLASVILITNDELRERYFSPKRPVAARPAISSRRTINPTVSAIPIAFSHPASSHTASRMAADKKKHPPLSITITGECFATPGQVFVSLTPEGTKWNGVFISTPPLPSNQEENPVIFPSADRLINNSGQIIGVAKLSSFHQAQNIYTDNKLPHIGKEEPSHLPPPSTAVVDNSNFWTAGNLAGFRTALGNIAIGFLFTLFVSLLKTLWQVVELRSWLKSLKTAH